MAAEPVQKVLLKSACGRAARQVARFAGVLAVIEELDESQARTPRQAMVPVVDRVVGDPGLELEIVGEGVWLCAGARASEQVAAVHSFAGCLLRIICGFLGPERRHKPLAGMILRSLITACLLTLTFCTRQRQGMSALIQPFDRSRPRRAPSRGVVAGGVRGGKGAASTAPMSTPRSVGRAPDQVLSPPPFTGGSQSRVPPTSATPSDSRNIVLMKQLRAKSAPRRGATQELDKNGAQSASSVVECPPTEDSRFIRLYRRAPLCR